MISLPKSTHETVLCFRKPAEYHSSTNFSIRCSSNYQCKFWVAGIASVIDSASISLTCRDISLLSSPFHRRKECIHRTYLTIRRSIRPFVLIFLTLLILCFLCLGFLLPVIFCCCSSVYSFEPFSSKDLYEVWSFVIPLHFSLLILVILLNQTNYVFVPSLPPLSCLSVFTDDERFLRIFQ